MNSELENVLKYGKKLEHHDEHEWHIHESQAVRFRDFCKEKGVAARRWEDPSILLIKGNPNDVCDLWLEFCPKGNCHLPDLEAESEQSDLPTS